MHSFARHSLIFYWQGERDAKDAFQRWRACTAEKKRRRASVKCVPGHALHLRRVRG
jgi:hypothetical protein